MFARTRTPRCSSFVFKTVHVISSRAPEVKEEGDLTGLFVLPGASTSQLKAAYQGFQSHQRGPKRLRRLQPSQPRPLSLSLVLACLEELRLLVPFPCGQEFREVLAHAAARSAFHRAPLSRGALRPRPAGPQQNSSVSSIWEGTGFGPTWSIARFAVSAKLRRAYCEPPVSTRQLEHCREAFFLVN